MKRVELVKHLQAQGCELFREGGRHSIFLNPAKQRVTAVPRHREINDFLVRKICRDLEIPIPE